MVLGECREIYQVHDGLPWVSYARELQTSIGRLVYSPERRRPYGRLTWPGRCPSVGGEVPSPQPSGHGGATCSLIRPPDNSSSSHRGVSRPAGVAPVRFPHGGSPWTASVRPSATSRVSPVATCSRPGLPPAPRSPPAPSYGRDRPARRSAAAS